HEIAARARLATGEVHLQDPERARLMEHPRPGRGVELVVAGVKCKRVGTVRAAERATVGQLGQQAERLVQRCGTRGRHGTSDPMSNFLVCACPYRKTGSHPASSAGQAFSGTCAITTPTAACRQGRATSH